MQVLLAVPFFMDISFLVKLVDGTYNLGFGRRKMCQSGPNIGRDTGENITKTSFLGSRKGL